MEISTVYGNSYSACTQSTKINASETEATEKTSKMSEAEEMAAFKKEFYEDLEKLVINKSIVNYAINISEKAFENMKADPDYRAKILSLLQRDLGDYYGSGPRRASVVLTVGATASDYRGDSWPICNDLGYYERSQNSFYKKSTVKKGGTKDIEARYLEKRRQARKLQKEILQDKAEEQQLEHDRLMKSWYSERRMTQASAAYEANVMTEPAGRRY